MYLALILFRKIQIMILPFRAALLTPSIIYLRSYDHTTKSKYSAIGLQIFRLLW